jgi:hypothetical protein
MYLHYDNNTQTLNEYLTCDCCGLYGKQDEFQVGSTVCIDCEIPVVEALLEAGVV